MMELQLWGGYPGGCVTETETETETGIGIHVHVYQLGHRGSPGALGRARC